MATALRTHGTQDLRRKTLKLLNTQNEPEIYDVLLGIVADELLDWDGHVEEELAHRAGHIRSFAVARLCLALDSVANRSKCTLRLKINREFPELGLVLTDPRMGPRITCEEFVKKWSTPLHQVENGTLDAATIDWLQGIVFRDERLDWQVRLPRGPVRILTKGSADGLPGLVEVQVLPRSTAFYLLYAEQQNDVLSPWLRDDCRGVRRFGTVQGLPAGWQIVHINEAIRDSIRDQIPILSFSNVRRIRFSGGLRSSAGNTFFAFSPPAAMVLDGKDGTEQVFCNGELLSQIAGDEATYQLPTNLPVGARILVEVKSGSFVMRRSFYLSGDFPWKLSEPVRKFNRWGLALPVGDESTVAVSGAMVFGPPSDVSSFRRPLGLARQFDNTRTPRVFYIGRRIGEIVSWPSDALPDQWLPVWEIPFGRDGHAFYCGDDPSTSLPEKDSQASKERRDLWKKVLWHDRKRIAPPRGRALTKLWHRFIETAHGA